MDDYLIPLTVMAGLKCHLCGSVESKTRHAFDEKRVICHCETCGVDWLFPRPTAKELALSTNKEYFSYFADSEIEKSKVSTFLRAQSESKMRKLGKVLEVGAGKAYITHFLRGMKVSAWGVERERGIWSSIEPAVRKYVVRGDFEKLNWKKKFDTLIMFDLIEHLSDPVRALSKSNSILKKGGRVLVITPDQSSWKRTLLGRKWSGYYLEHNFIFQPKTIKYLATETGFKVLAVNKFYKKVTWRYFWKAMDHRYPFFLWRVLARMNINTEMTIDDDSMLAILQRK